MEKVSNWKIVSTAFLSIWRINQFKAWKIYKLKDFGIFGCFYNFKAFILGNYEIERLSNFKNLNIMEISSLKKATY